MALLTVMKKGSKRSRKWTFKQTQDMKIPFLQTFVGFTFLVPPCFSVTDMHNLPIADLEFAT